MCCQLSQLDFISVTYYGILSHDLVLISFVNLLSELLACLCLNLDLRSLKLIPNEFLGFFDVIRSGKGRPVGLSR